MKISLVYWVAGLSSRFGGRIKQLIRVGKNNETLIECSLNQALPAGFDKIILVVGEKTQEAFKELIGNSYKGIPIYYALQEYDKSKRDKPWGTTDAMCCALPYLDGPCVACNGDDLYGTSSFKIAVEHLKKEKTNCAIGYKLSNVLPDKDAVNRAIIEIKNNKITMIREIFNVSRDNFKNLGLSENSLISMNIFGFQLETIRLLKILLDNFKQVNKDDKKIECLIPNSLNELINKKKIEIAVYPTKESWLGVTNPEDEEILRNRLKIMK